MAKTKIVGHTPGPWETYYQGWCHTLTIKRVGNYPGHVSLASGNHETDTANARLIAAAPDLLEAAKGIITSPLPLLDATLHRLRIVIASAEGK